MTFALPRLQAATLLATLWLGQTSGQQAFAQPAPQVTTAAATAPPADTATERPVVRRIVAPGPTAVTSPTSATAPQPTPGRAPAIGDTTRRLLAAQANPERPGSRLPILGATADLSWQRYLDSFRHALPEWFENRLEQD